MVVLAPLMISCSKDPLGGEDTSGAFDGTTNGSSASNCSVTPSETARPFPTKNPGSLVSKRYPVGSYRGRHDCADYS